MPPSRSCQRLPSGDISEVGAPTHRALPRRFRGCSPVVGRTSSRHPLELAPACRRPRQESSRARPGGSRRCRPQSGCGDDPARRRGRPGALRGGGTGGPGPAQRRLDVAVADDDHSGSAPAAAHRQGGAPAARSLALSRGSGRVVVGGQGLRQLGSGRARRLPRGGGDRFAGWRRGAELPQGLGSEGLRDRAGQRLAGPRAAGGAGRAHPG